MFPFGSFLTQLPLLIIGALYMLYLGLCAVNRTKEISVSEITAASVKYADKAIGSKSVDYYKLVSLSNEKGNVKPVKFYGFAPILPYYNIHYYQKDLELNSISPDFSLFSRPPPSVS